MDLIHGAQHFIESEDHRGIVPLLQECVRARSVEALVAVKRLYADMYGGMTFNYELKAPAAFCLPIWGEAGLAALVDGMREIPEFKNTSLTLQILATLAARLPLSNAVSFVHDHELLASINAIPDLRKPARRLLREVVMGFASDEEAAEAIGWSTMRQAILGTGLAEELFGAFATRMLVVSRSVLDSYEHLIAESPSDESQFQEFFERHPQLLDQLTLELWPRPDFHGVQEPDFLLRRSDGSYLIVELETPSKPLVTESDQTSAHVTHAVNQALNYRAFLMERFAEASAFFPEFQEPECLIIIGLERDLSDSQARILRLENNHRSRLRIVGFDWIGRRAESIVRNLVEVDAATTHGRVRMT